MKLVKNLNGQCARLRRHVSDKLFEMERSYIPKNLPVFPALPDALHDTSRFEESVFLKLRGARIVRIGTTMPGVFEGGGLILDYQLPDSSIEYRMIFAFNDQGLWVEYDE
jgi:hypothetical protein